MISSKNGADFQHENNRFLNDCLNDQSLFATASLSPERLLQGQQQVLEMIATGQPLRKSLRRIAEFAEACVPDMFASILYYDPYRQCLVRGGYGRLPGVSKG